MTADTVGDSLNDTSDQAHCDPHPCLWLRHRYACNSQAGQLRREASSLGSVPGESFWCTLPTGPFECPALDQLGLVRVGSGSNWEMPLLSGCTQHAQHASHAQHARHEQHAQHAQHAWRAVSGTAVVCTEVRHCRGGGNASIRLVKWLSNASRSLGRLVDHLNSTTSQRRKFL